MIKHHAPNPHGKCDVCGGMWGEHVGKCPRRFR